MPFVRIVSVFSPFSVVFYSRHGSSCRFCFNRKTSCHDTTAPWLVHFYFGVIYEKRLKYLVFLEPCPLQWKKWGKDDHYSEPCGRGGSNWHPLSSNLQSYNSVLLPWTRIGWTWETFLRSDFGIHSGQQQRTAGVARIHDSSQELRWWHHAQVNSTIFQKSNPCLSGFHQVHPIFPNFEFCLIFSNLFSWHNMPFIYFN